MACAFVVLPGCRYNANKLTRKFAIQTAPTHAWAVPSRDMLPQVCKGAHVFHCWLGSARVIEIHEVRGWLGQLADRVSRFHVRCIPATASIDAYSRTCVRLATQVRTSHAPLRISDADKIALSAAKLDNVRCVRVSAPSPCSARVDTFAAKP